ncbi:hypothetical protein Dsin_030020 [Dipteronia sinensis]|uniref:Uncharacterized protein n=1 Tax=Dipteronia sinensis TaxID=43782 RepID=A0AAE0DQT0_9ROSI|nr:hypothetical protein Dsin_030020 [Dipteronia sinensis]
MPGQCTSDPNLNFTKKEMEFLELRQRLKGYIRDELKKEYAASVCDNSQEKKKLPSNNYGSFFGHSQPSIARRFLQESKTMVEVQQLAAKLMNSHHSNKKSHVSTASKADSDKASEEQLISMPKLHAITKGGSEQNSKFTTATRHPHTPDKHKASFPSSSIRGKRKSEEEIEFVQTKKAKVMQNHPHSSLKDMRKSSKEKAISAQAKSLSKQQIKCPMQDLCHDDEVDDSYISSLCPSLFRRNHTKHVENYDYDDDDECMVSNFNDIQKEERKSAKIAREEDRIEQLRLEQEEKERLRIIVKKQKQHHN